MDLVIQGKCRKHFESNHVCVSATVHTSIHMHTERKILLYICAVVYCIHTVVNITNIIPYIILSSRLMFGYQVGKNGSHNIKSTFISVQSITKFFFIRTINCGLNWKSIFI